LGKPGDPSRSGIDNRMFMEAVLWKARTGSAWRDLPEVFGKWNTFFKRFNDWSTKGVFRVSSKHYPMIQTWNTP